MLWWQADEGIRGMLRLSAKEGVMKGSIEAVWNGFWLTWPSGHFVSLSEEPTPHEVELIRRGFEAGYSLGKHDGRAILQNEFRNLMNCQPR